MTGQMSGVASNAVEIADFQAWPLENQVAQLFMLGYTGAEPSALTRRFLELGLGGLIFFRDNFEGLPDAASVKSLLDGLAAQVPNSYPQPLLGIDQEGGQVERLPHTIFPTALTPMAVARSPEPKALARDMYGLMARQLRALGFNLDFFPTLDVNLNPLNPIIGVRSFGSDPEAVWRLGQCAMEAFAQAGVIAVGKHFPGHGNGTVDSHLALPTLVFTEAELAPFQRAVAAGLPAMLVAHGYYPALQTTEVEKNLPSSASPTIVQGLLREQLGFDGVVITDDMCMGAITENRNPLEAALVSLRAGVDILLYKQSTEEEWKIYEGVLAAFRTGDLPMSLLHQSIQRILRMKQALAAHPAPTFSPDDFSPAACRAQADRLAQRGVAVRGAAQNILPLDPAKPLLLVHPERQAMGNYAFDQPTSPELDTVCREAGLSAVRSLTYPLQASDPEQVVQALLTKLDSDSGPEMPSAICMVTFNPQLRPLQVALYQQLKRRFPGVPVMLVPVGMPDETGLLPGADLEVSLCSYRPASMRALAALLIGTTPVD